MSCKTIKVFIILVLSFAVSSCFYEGPDFPAGEVTGYRPVYATAADTTITFTEARPVHMPGKIYSYGNFLLINEKHEGIHVFDNTNPSTPKPVGFLKLHGNEDMAIRGSVLYADVMGNIIALDVSDLPNVKELSRIRTTKPDVPPISGYYFECVDPTKGSVLSWELVELHDPKCYQ